MRDFSVVEPLNQRTKMRRRNVEGALSKIPVAIARNLSSRTVLAVS
jgi:hypothetical protein